MKNDPAEPGLILLEPCEAMPLGRAVPAAVGQPICDEPAARAEVWRRQRHWTMLAISAAVVILAMVLEVRWDQRVALVGLGRLPLPETCMARSLFGVPCPGCGLTRSLVYLAHGRWVASLAAHRLGWLMAAAVVLQFPYRLLCLRRSGGWPLGERIPRLFGQALIFLLVVNWLFETIRCLAGGG